MADTSSPELRVFATQPIPVEINQRPRRWIRFVAFLAVITPIALTLIQYIESVIVARISRVDQDFTQAVAGLSSTSTSLKAEALRELHRVSFTPSPPRRGHGAGAMFAVLADWIASRSRLHHLARGRTVFRNYLREAGSQPPGILAFTTGEVAADWIVSERARGSDLSEYQFILLGGQLSHSNFSHKDLSRIDLSYADLTRVTFDNAVVTGARFISSNLAGALFRSTRADAADFQRSSNDNTSFTFVHCPRCNFTLARISNSDFSNARLLAARFDEAQISNARFQSASLVGASFRTASIMSSDFGNADLYNADFTGADLSGSDLRFARNLNNALSWCGAVLPPSNLLPGDFTRRATSC